MGSRNLATVKMLMVVTLVISMTDLALGARRLSEEQFSSHGGAVLSSDIAVGIVWYGQFTAEEKSVVTDFVVSLTSAPQAAAPSVGQWWNTIDQLYLSNAATQVLLANQVSDDQYSLGKSLTGSQIAQLASNANPKKGGIVLVLTDQDVAVDGFCRSRCGLHGSDASTGSAYVWAGNSAKQCAGQCAWPFAQPAYGPPGAPLVAPNGDVGLDGLVMTLASMVASAVTNPFGEGYYQGDKAARLEACTACPGVYGSHAYPGYAGDVPVDSATGASYNANGANGRKYLLPALFDPSTSTCSTLV